MKWMMDDLGRLANMMNCKSSGKGSNPEHNMLKDHFLSFSKSTVVHSSIL